MLNSVLQNVSTPNKNQNDSKQSRLLLKCFKPFQSVGLVATAMILSSCAGLSVVSEKLDLNSQYIEGLSYFLPKSMISIKVARSSDKLSVTQPTVLHKADPRAHFLANFLPSKFADDDFSITLNSDGLISMGKVVNTDQTVAIVNAAGQLALDALPLIRTAASNVSAQDFHLDLVFDPNDPAQVSYASRQLQNEGFTLQLKNVDGHFVHETHHSVADTQSEFLQYSDEISGLCNGSLCFRLPRSLIVEIRSTDGLIKTRDVVTVADHRKVASIDISRAECVSKTSEFTAENGFLTQLHLIKPSEALACLQIPSSVVKTLIGLGEE